MAEREYLDGRTIVVTGANAGIGLEIARGLALKRATVILACRDEAKAEAARKDIVEDTMNERVETMIVDVSRKESVKAFAAELAKKHDRLDVLVNNAGVWLGERLETPEGIERTWATNVLGYFWMIRELLDVLKKSAPSRIVDVASKLARGLDLDDPEFARRRYTGRAAYAQSKEADRRLTWALEPRLEGTRVTANAMHPGLVATELPKEKGIVGALARPYFKVLGKKPELGADTAVWLASSDEVERSTGNFWVDRKIVKCPFRDAATNDRLFAMCEERW